MDYVNYRVIPREDYEGDVKLRGVHILCYKKKQLDDMYPNDDYVVVGETKAKNKKRIIDNLYLADLIDISKLETDDDGNEIPLLVSNTGEHSKLLYRRAGYVLVGPDTYIALLKFRFAFIFWLFLGVLVLSGLTGLLVGLLIGRPGKTPNDTEGPAGLNPLPPVESHVTKVDDETMTPVENGGGSVSMEYTLYTTLTKSDGRMVVYFMNPGRSNHDIVLEVYAVSGDNEALIARSGRVQPGYRVTDLYLIDDAPDLSEGTYEGRYQVLYYDPVTGERALIESNIVDVRIFVKP